MGANRKMRRASGLTAKNDKGVQIAMIDTLTAAILTIINNYGKLNKKDTRGSVALGLIMDKIINHREDREFWDVRTWLINALKHGKGCPRVEITIDTTTTVVLEDKAEKPYIKPKPTAEEQAV